MNDSILKKSFNQFNKIVTVSLIVGILIISCFIVSLIFYPEPGYLSSGILNEDQKLGDYKPNATIGEPINFYVGVDNYLGENLTFNVRILKGDRAITIMNETGSYNAVLNHPAMVYCNKASLRVTHLPLPWQLPLQELLHKLCRYCRHHR